MFYTLKGLLKIEFYYAVHRIVYFYFLIAWKAPNPPIPEYCIELGFTTSAGASSSTPPPQAESEAITEEEVSEEAPEEEVVESDRVAMAGIEGGDRQGV